MTGNDSKKPGLSARQLRAMTALLEEPSITSAAAKAGVSQKTMFRWLNDAIFSEAYRTARSKLLEDALTSLQAASVEAVGVLRAIMNDVGVNPFCRVGAAKAVLELALKGKGIIAFEDRLRVLEEDLSNP
jgi:hypothetical protein